ncbi:hypothetical protein LTR62_004240 [Meristemomyces frigidus]|uniref:Uncharacterized protein n=1 Tax=Meristemomyces frigidus TaxID=1508187 RepID=A0AAN7YGA2_9PEZI|nr:hypothetical protein LTR62_004240 [Meristemomyces frigidus]
MSLLGGASTNHDAGSLKAVAGNGQDNKKHRSKEKDVKKGPERSPTPPPIDISDDECRPSRTVHGHGMEKYVTARDLYEEFKVTGISKR